MRRREFLADLVGALAISSSPSRGETAGKRPLVGFIVPGTPESHGKWLAAFAKHLSDLGWVDGQTVTLDFRYGSGKPERYPEIGAELAELKADVIVTSITQPIEAIRRIAPNTPIVHTALTSGSPYISSLAHPGGTVTGTSQLGPELGGKRLEILSSIVPGLKRLAVLAVKSDRKREPETTAIVAAGRTLGVEVSSLTVEGPDEIAPAIASVTGKADALYVIIDPLFTIHQIEINKLALAARLPTIYALRTHVASGGLAFYGANFEDLFRHSADYVGKILRGAKPGDLPVEQPTKFELVINLKTADALGLNIPMTILAAAELIE